MPPSGCVSLMAILLPLTVMPLAFCALPSMTAWAPAIVVMNGAAGDCIVGLSARFIANT